MSSLTIGKLAKECGVNIDTIRYYERQNLIEPEGRSLSGYRNYSRHSVNRLRFIRKTQSLGFTLKEIKNLLEITEQEDADCGDIRECARAKIAEIKPKIQDLQKIKKGLEALANYCPGRGKPLSECTILHFFYDQDKEGSSE
ncbi:MAG TPA: heavy metal-responsive transcriptional regulator [Hellea balneolensis]|uniref:Heavy metal-responsive transcriptional regulator n=1 Tax=Hellea balneolensis TaxID=287478 RepID=A0A7C5QR06_9PROT|nr:heavy metal-responsive transcriptional regulator [Hellea balneolensis]